MVISLTGTKWSLHRTRSQLRFYLERHVSLALHIPSTFFAQRAEEQQEDCLQPGTIFRSDDRHNYAIHSSL